MLNWIPIKNKDGTTNQHCIESFDHRYRISRSTVNGKDVYTTWRGAVAIFYGTSQKAKEAAYKDSLKPHEVTHERRK